MPRPSRSGAFGLYEKQDGRKVVDIRWKDPATGEVHRKTKTLPFNATRSDARAYAADVLSQFMRGGGKAVEKSRPFDAALVDYLDACDDKNRASTVKRKRGIGKHLTRHFGSRLLQKLTPEDIEEYTAWRKRCRVRGHRQRTSRKLSNGAVNRELVTLKTFLQHAARRGWMPFEVAAKVRASIQLLPEPKGRERTLGKGDEEMRLYAACHPRLWAVCAWAKMTGMRLGEILALDWEWVDEAREVVVIPSSVTKEDTAKALPILRGMASVLMEARKWTKHRSGPVFLSNRRRRWTLDGFQKSFAKARAKAKLVDFKFHDLRHTAASDMLNEGVDLAVVGLVLGHKSMQTTKRYAHWQMEVKRKALQKIAE